MIGGGCGTFRLIVVDCRRSPSAQPLGLWLGEICLTSIRPLPTGSDYERYNGDKNVYLV